MANLYLQSSNLSILHIEASTFCNAHCPHCPRYTNDGFLHDYIPSTHLELSALHHGLDPAQFLNLKEVIIEGDRGDPLMNPDIQQIIEFFNFVPLVKVYTNGSLRSIKFWRELAKIPNLLVIWSIDGLEDTNPLYRIGTDYQKIITNAQAYINAGGRAVWKCVVFKHNEHQIDNINNLAQQFGFEGTQFIKAYQYRFQNLSKWKVYVNGQYQHDISPSDISQEQLSKFSTFKNETYLKKNNLSCPWLKDYRVYINALGQIIPCCMMVSETTNDYFGKTILQEMVGGTFDNINLHNYTLNEILYQHYGQQFNQTLQTLETMHPVCSKGCSEILLHNGTRFGEMAEIKFKNSGPESNTPKKSLCTSIP